MKYVRTKENVYELMFPNTEHRISFDHKTIECAYYTTKYDWVAKKDVIKASDNLEELCDCYSYDTETVKDISVARSWKRCNTEREIFGCIKTSKGLIYIAKMNSIGGLNLYENLD